MKFYHTIGLYLLAGLMTVQAFMMPIVYLDFKLQQDYIARVLCINRDKPALHCNGRCILMQKIRKTREKEQSAEHSGKVREVIWWNTCVVLELVFSPAKPLKDQPFSGITLLYIYSHIYSFFHPPQCLFF